MILKSFLAPMTHHEGPGLPDGSWPTRGDKEDMFISLLIITNAVISDHEFVSVSPMQF